MENPCYKCGEPVEQGTPFCLHCRAPQIRVVIAAGATSPASGGESDVAVSLPASQSEPVLAVPVRWSDALTPCALAALAALVLVFLGLYPAVSLLLAGFLAVVFYRQRRPGAALQAGSGARLGALSGIFSFAGIAVLAALLSSSQELRGKMHDQFLENAQKWVASRPADPNFQSALEQLKTPEGLMTALIVGSIFFLILAVALGSLGGAIGGAILGRRRER